MRKVLLAILLLSLTPIVSMAQVDREETKGVKVHFRKGHSNLDENYRNNKTALSEFADKVDAYYSDTTSGFRQIRVVSSVSPEGTKSVNERIAKQRAVSISTWVKRELSADLDYAIDATSVDWELLVSLVEQRDDVPNKAEVLDVLRNTPVSVEQNGVVVEKRFAELRALKGGVPYRWLHDATHRLVASSGGRLFLPLRSLLQCHCAIRLRASEMFWHLTSLSLQLHTLLCTRLMVG